MTYRKTADSYYFQFLIISLAFLLVNFSEKLGQVYIALIIADYIWTKADKKVVIRFEKSPEGRMKSVFIAAAATGIFLFITGLILKVFSPETFSLAQSATQSVFQLLATTVPAFSGSRIFTLIGFGLVVAIIESMFFFKTLFEGLADYYNFKIGTHIDPLKLNKSVILLALTIASLFVLFHVSAKGFQSILLICTFLFALIQLWLVNHFKHLREAVLMHVFTNTLAVLYSLGMMPEF